MFQIAVGPAGGDRLDLGPELHAFHAVLVGVAEGRALPAAEGVIGDRHGDRDVDPDHADFDAGGEVAGRAAVLGEDGDAVAVLVLAGKRQGFLEAGGADDLQHGTEDLFLVGLHLGRDVVEQRRADEIAVLVALQGEVAAVDDQFGAVLDALFDPAGDLGAMLGGDHGAVVGAGVGRDADPHGRDLGDHPLAQFVGGLLADGHDDRQGHAAFAGRAVGRAGQVLDDLIHVGVGQDDAVVLGAAHGLDAFPVRRAGLVDVGGDVGRTDEADGVDLRMGQDGVDRRLVAVDDVQHAGGGARFHHQLAEANRQGRITLRGLEDEGVADGDGDAEHPHRDHGREVERGDAGDHAQRLAHGIDVDAGPRAPGVFALQRMGDAAGELDHFQTALDVAFRVGDDLAVLGRQQFGQFVDVGLDQPLELEHHPRAALGVGGGPAFEGVLGGLDGAVHLGDRSQLHPRLDLAGVRVEDVGEPARGAREGSAVDEVVDVAHADPRTSELETGDRTSGLFAVLTTRVQLINTIVDARRQPWQLFARETCMVEDVHIDILVIGAGLAGLRALHTFRAQGFGVQVLEASDEIGGVWNFNRYPGARCDVER